MAKTEAQYDAAVIQQMADKLYAKAAGLVVQSALSWGVVGLVGSALVMAAMGVQGGAAPSSNMSQTVVFFATAITAFMGFQAGQTKALALRFQAQQALVLAKIEQNTRGAQG